MSPATASAVKSPSTATALNSPLLANGQQAVTTLNAVHAEGIDMAPATNILEQA